MPEILYRKWRPRTFAELAGQEHVTTTLVNALASGRVAHAYLFAGPRGTGKTSTGRLLGKALNCPDRQDGEPCNRCESCLSFLAGRAMDLVEMDAASNRGIEEIRSLRDKVAFHPSSGEYKVYLIDEVHMLTEAAFNALLKTLEEPPPHVVFILATTEAHKLPATVLSRCQRFDFRRVPMAAALDLLGRISEAEGFRCEPAGLELIVRQATGSMRDAINLLDQLVTSYGPELSVEHVRAGLGLIDDERAGKLAHLALAGDLGGGLSLIASVRDDGLDLRQFQKEVVKELRGLLLVKSGLDPASGVSAEQRQEMTAAVAAVPVPYILTALRAFGEADLKPDPNSTLPLDIALADCILGREAGAPAAARPAVEAPARTSAPGPARPEASRPGPRPAPEAQPRPVRAPSPPLREEAAPASRREAVAPPEPAATNGVTSPAPAAEPPDLMPRLYEALRARHEVQVAALLNSPCDIIEGGEGEIVLGFRFENHARKIQEPQNLKVLTETLAQVLGRSVTVRCRHDPAVEQWARRPPARSPLVRAAQEMGARVLTSGDEE